MDTSSTPYKAHRCSKCPGDTEYYCVSCPCDLCPQCKENHFKNLKTIDHNVVTYREKLNYIQTQEQDICELIDNVHTNKIQIPSDIETAFETKRQEHRTILHTIRSEALFYRPILLIEVKHDFRRFLTELSLCQSEMCKKAQKMKILISESSFNVDFKHKCLTQKKEMNTHMSSLQRYVHIYEQSAINPLQFLSSIKTALPQINLTLHTCRLSVAESINKGDLIESLSAIQIKERGNRRVGNQCLLKTMSSPKFHQSLTVTGVDRCYHLSCVTSDQVWVSDLWSNLILTNTEGFTLRNMHDFCSNVYGAHTVNNESELIYIDKLYNIKKLSKDVQTTSTFIPKPDSLWEPICVYWSKSTGDLLVTMYRKYTEFTGIGKVTRYTKTGKLTQTIQVDHRGRKLYTEPCYITDNNNGDVVVSDCVSLSSSGAVVVTERGGRHRFSYRGHPSGSVLEPRGVCTDALSRILVCDVRTNTVQMLDRNGQFLSHLLKRPSGIFSPRSLSYDMSSHRLWVGSRNSNTVVVYRYITRKNALIDMTPTTSDMVESLSEYPNTETTESKEKNTCRLKLCSPPELIFSFIMKDFHRCCHISPVTEDRIWICDGDNLILTNAKGERLHRLESVLKCDTITGIGPCTVNGKSDLIYIDRNYNINKLSKDMESATILVDSAYSKWRPRCVYWSPSTDDLLVGMCKVNLSTGKVTRYDQSGQPTHTIQCDNSRLELYREPHYITENNNGDVVVSDYAAIVVTGRGGRHRFTYSGHPSGSALRPCGICTDALSHILVCDVTTKTVHMLNRDGHFLSFLLTNTQENGIPWSLSYDVNTHRLWVGSRYNNKVCVYRYIDRQGTLTRDDTHVPHNDAFSSFKPA
nr:uncharacterized protein LOC105338987 [Crassostrea gigas]XP_034305458.1 uncharacterized protein LOC105338987 [Crassostrea gigas]